MFKFFSNLRKSGGGHTITAATYKIVSEEDITLKYFTVINNDFANFWYVFNGLYGRAEKVRWINNETIVCKARGKKYTIKRTS